MINLQIDIQMFSEFIPEVFLTLFILLPPKISPLSTQVQPGKVRKLLIWDVLKEHQDQVLCFGVSHVIAMRNLVMKMWSWTAALLNLYKPEKAD